MPPKTADEPITPLGEPAPEAAKPATEVPGLENNGQLYTLSYRYRPRVNGSTFTIRFSGSAVGNGGLSSAPAALGARPYTPGAANSVP